jgi:hypothetical protein
VLKKEPKKMGISERHLRLLLEQNKVADKKLGHDWLVLSPDYRHKGNSRGRL